MKRKQQGLISILIVVFILIPTAIYAVYFLQVSVEGNTVRSPKMPSEYIVPDTTVLKEISMLEKKMTELANPVDLESLPDKPIRFWQYSDQPYHRYKTFNHGEEKANFNTVYTLTFTFTSGEKKFCVIDGSFYPQGAELQDGGKILKIKSGKVLVKKGELTRWISLPETTKWGEIQ